jgi:hypothetical protein
VSSDDVRLPQLLPILSAGKHRNPRKGACFMEMASFLAGERWSDHPVCTHPLLAALARHVNDYISAAGRQRLVALIPSVIGTTSDDLHVDARIALRCAATALPHVAAGRQKVMAVSVLACERVLADLDRRAAGSLTESSKSALAKAPHAARWAEDFVRTRPTSEKVFRRQAAPTIVRCAVDGIAQACVPDPDRILHDLLVGAIEDCAGWVHRGPDPTAGIDTTGWPAGSRRRVEATARR